VSKSLAADRLKLALATWAQETTKPNIDSAVGSLWMRNGSYPTIPTELYLKTAATANGWIKENLVNINVFNVKDYGALGDGVTNDTAAIQAAIDAANAAGGGQVYFPATANYYSVVKTAGGGHADVLSVSNVANVTFIGDGYASKIRQTGSAEASETHLFGVHNGSNKLKFINLFVDVSLITNPDPTSQNHALNIYGKAGDPNGGPSNVEIRGCYFGRCVGDAVRFIGEVGQEVQNVRVLNNIFDAEDGNGGSRTCVSAQRNSRYIQCHFNWIRGSHDQQIDWEPTAGPGPIQWSIIGNHIDNESHVVDAVTLSGAGDTNASMRNIYAYNTLNNGGGIFGVAVGPLVFHGNYQELSVGGTGTIVLEQFGQYEQVTSNIVRNTELDVPQATILVSTVGVSITTDLLIADNLVFQTSTRAGGAATIAIQDVDNAVLTGNHCSVNDTQINSVGLTSSTVSRAVNKNVFSGNMIFNDGAAAFLAAVRASTSAAHNLKNLIQSFNHANLGVGSTNGIRWDVSGGALYTGGQQACCNNLVGVTGAGQALNFGGVGGPVIIEGETGPGTQIQAQNFPTATEGNATGPVGSINLNSNSSAGAGKLFNIKESGSGNTGWIGVGGFDFIMGAAAGSTATAARFFAPGGMALAVETATEIQWVVPRPCTIRNLRLVCIAGTGGGNNTYRIRKNGVNANPTLTIANTATSGTNTLTTTAVAGDLISMQVTKTVAPATPQTNIIIATELV